jgi:uncharacterized membrane protein YeaQ/YmgE (transglycosylase-associated protein family)
MNIVIWLVVGGVIGWIASLVVGTINQAAFNLPALGVSLAGAVILLVIVNLVRRGTARG